MTELTIFTAPKPFTDPHIATIQRNAIRSWTSLGATVTVLLIGDEAGMPEVAAELGVAHLPDVARNRWGTPLISSIFELARTHSDAPLLAYVNADILLMSDFVEASRQVAAQLARFLIVGRRWNLDVRRALDFNPGWEARLQAEVRQRGRLHKPSGSDYFVFRRDGFAHIPPFAVGRAGWDNWMIYHARSSGWAVVDATRAITIVHQDHDYRHLPQGEAHYLLEESDLNRALAGGKANMYVLQDANARMVAGQVEPIPGSLARLLRRLEITLTPHTVHPRGLRWRLARRLRRWWKRLENQSEPPPEAYWESHNH